MSRHYGQGIAYSRQLSTRNRLAHIGAPCTGHIIGVSIKSSTTNSGGDSIFQVRLEGANLFAPIDRPTIVAGTQSVLVTGLSIACNEMDDVEVDLNVIPAGGIGGILIMQVIFEDGISATGNATQLQGRDVSASAPSDGQALAWNATGSVWQPATISGGGGGGTPVGAYMALGHPTSPSAFDDEFEGPTFNTTLWTMWQAGDVTRSMGNSMVKLVQTSQGSYKLAGFFQNVPSGDWVAMARLALEGPKANYCEGGLALFQNASGAPNTTDVITFGRYNASSGYSHAGENWDDHNTYNSALSGYSAGLSSVWDDVRVTQFNWFVIVKSGTNYKFFTIPDFFSMEHSGRYNGTLGFVPAQIGFYVYNNGSGGDVALYVDCFRVFATDTNMIGGEV